MEALKVKLVAEIREEPAEETRKSKLVLNSELDMAVRTIADLTAKNARLQHDMDNVAEELSIRRRCECSVCSYLPHKWRC